MATGIGGEVFWLCPTLDNSYNDLSSNGYTTTQVGGSIVSDSSNGGTLAFEFNGTSDYIGLPSSVGLNTDYTISCWVKFDQLGSGTGSSGVGRTLYQKGYTNASGEPVQTRIDSGGNINSGSYACSGNSVTSTSPVSTGTWYHILIIRDTVNNVRQLWIDGSMVSQNSAGGQCTNNTEQWSIGAAMINGSRQRFLDGRMDDIRYFDSVLTSIQIGSLASQRGYEPAGGEGEGGGGSSTPTGIGGEVLWICPTLSSTNDVDDLSGNISTPSTHSGASVISETGSGGTHSISFNGTQGLDLGSPTIHSGSTFSYSCWFKTTQGISTGGGAGLIGQYIIPSDRGPSLVLHTGRANFYYQSNGGTYNANEVTGSASASNDGNWHHVAAVFEGSSGTAKIYVDGSLVATGSNVPASVNQTRNLYIGDSNNGLLSGSMDDIRAFDKVLTEQEIVSLSQTRGYEPTNGIGDEAIWLCPSIDDTATDLSPASNTVTYNGSLTVVTDASNGGTKAYDGTTGTADTVTVDWTNSNVTSRSMSLWCKPIGFQQFANNDVVKGQMQLASPGDGVAFRTTLTASPWNENYTVGTPAGVYNDTWHHFAMVQDTTNTLVYVDGTLYATYSTASNIQYGSGNQTFTLAEDDCYIDDFRVFNRTLTSSEVTSLASARGYTSGGGGEGEGGNLDFHPFNSTHVLD